MKTHENSTNEDSDQPIKRCKKRSQTIKDIINEQCQDIIKYAYNFYKRALTWDNPFPVDSYDQKEVTDMTVDAWDAACNELGIEEQLDPVQQELNLVQVFYAGRLWYIIWLPWQIRDRGSQFRGQLKDTVHSLLVDVYGFQDIKKLQNPNKERIEAAKAANRGLVNTLKGEDDPMWFMYAVSAHLH